MELLYKKVIVTLEVLIIIEKKYKYNYLYFFMLIYAFVFSFVSEGAGKDNVIVVPFIEIHYKTHIILFTLIILVILSFVSDRYKVKLNPVNLALIYRAIFLMIPILYTQNTSNYWGFYATNIIVLLVFELSKKYSLDYRRILRVLVAFGLILSIEVIATFLMAKLDYFGDYYKYFMAIPIGKTNYIGCFLLPTYVLADMDELLSKKKKFVILLTFILAIVLLKSRGTVVLLLIYYLVKIFSLITKKGLKLKTSILVLIISIVTLALLSSNAPQITDSVVNFVFGNKNGTFYNTELSFLDRLTSERFLVNDEIIDLAMRYPLFGNGTVYEIGTYRAHNFITDAFYQSGIVGTALYIFALFIWFKKIYKFRANHTIKKFYIPVFIILLQGMIETSLFLIPTDILLWCLLGISYSYANLLEKNWIIGNN